MAVSIISRITAALLVLLLVTAGASAARAQGAAGPVPAPGGEGVTVLQLFASGNCPFCPAAERNFKDIIAGNGLIGITCMVDYFDTGTPGVLARPFCREEQDVYVHMLRSGARFTPQLVVNGTQQVAGQSLQKISDAINGARDRPVALQILPGAGPGDYAVLLPAMPGGGGDDKGKDGNNKTGQYVLRTTMIRSAPAADLRNVATALIEGGIWDGKKTVWTVTPPQDKTADGFVVTVQDRNSGRITAAGQYMFPPAASPPAP